MSGTPPEKIRFIMHRFSTGGVERMLLNVSRQLPEYEIHLLILNNDFDGIYHRIPAHVHTDSFETFSLIRGLRSLSQKNKYLSKLCSLLLLISQMIIVKYTSRYKADYTVNFSDTLSTLLVANMCKGKKISWIHLNPSVIATSRWARIYKWLYAKCNTVVCVCEDQREIFRQQLMLAGQTDNTRVIYNTIDTAAIDLLLAENYQKNSSPYFLMVARLDTRSKDFFTVIDAFTGLKATLNIPHQMIFLGEGPDRKLIQDYIDSNAPGDVFLAGNSINPYLWMRDAEIFIFSSKFEGFGLVLLEALYCGVPVISTNCKVGPREILSDGEYGVLLDVGDAKGMQNAMKNLLSSTKEELYTIMAKGRKRAEGFDIKQTSRINKLFKEI